MWLAARHVPDWLGFAPTAMTMISIGSIAIALIGAVDFLVGTQLRGMTGSDQVAYLATPAGLLYSALLVVFAFMPALANWPRHAT